MKDFDPEDTELSQVKQSAFIVLIITLCVMLAVGITLRDDLGIMLFFELILSVYAALKVRTLLRKELPSTTCSQSDDVSIGQQCVKQAQEAGNTSYMDYIYMTGDTDFYSADKR